MEPLLLQDLVVEQFPPAPVLGASFFRSACAFIPFLLLKLPPEMVPSELSRPKTGHPPVPSLRVREEELVKIGVYCPMMPPPFFPRTGT